MLGIDVSNNNGNINFNKVKAANVECCYIKATEGATFRDGYLYTNYCNAKQNGLKVGFYHFLVGTSEPEVQAYNFYNYIKDKVSDLIPMLDVETNFDNLCNYIVRFIEKFKQLTDMEIGIYTYTGFIPYIRSISNSIKDIKLWEANYNNKPWELTENFFSKRVGHQYTETGKIDGITGVCDVNQFNYEILLKSTRSGEWLKDNTGWWYKHTDGSYTKADWEKINGEWYYFDYKGYMCTGWIVVKEKDYYLYSNGQMAHDCELYGYKIDSSGLATKIE